MLQLFGLRTIEDIKNVEYVQKRFRPTKRIVGLRDSACRQIKHFKSREPGSTKTAIDLLYTYKIQFGLNHVDWTVMFTFNPVTHTRGHRYKLYAKSSRVNVRYNCF